MKNFVLGFLVAAVVLTGGYFIYTRRAGDMAGKTSEQAKIRYHCPMHPTYISDKPGDCPICGMKLVPMEPPSRDSHTSHEPGQAGSPSDQTAEAQSIVPGYVPVTIPQDRIQSMGITVAEARRMGLDQSFRTFGRVTFDETKVYHVHTKFEGFIESLYVNYVGEFVKKGDPLFSIYSPELYATENEYLLALRAREQMPVLPGSDAILNTVGKVDLVAAARQRLALWDIGDKEISELEKSRKPLRALTITSPESGYVTGKTALQGMRVMPGDNLYDIVDLSTVWVLADIYEVNLPSVNIGQPASVSLAYRPGKTWHGRVAFVDPTVDPATRTVKARLEFSNPNNELKPDMYADVVIGGTSGKGVAVPESAVISTGERNIIFVAKGGGVFEPREVTLGVRVRNLYEIKQGVSEGEKVVTGANFLLDSESKLKAAASAGPGDH
jgi:membrane fusion protein, copper/silver efflux system